MSVSLAVCAIALLVEALFGYPNRLLAVVGHPVMWMGALVARLDRSWNKENSSASRRRFVGAGTIAALVILSGAAAWATSAFVEAILPPIAASLCVGIIASSCLAQRSLDEHVRAVADALETVGIVAGRRAVSAIVGRETAALDSAGVARAAIESLAENFADGVVAPAVWLALLGLPGGVLYKAINTADSMIGHRTPRHDAFGFCAAKLDDVASWPGARLAALWIVSAAALVPGASPHDAWRVMRRDARGHPSPNAGWPEAAMAGALGVRLGGPRAYAGQILDDAVIGDGLHPADVAAIRVALRVYRYACGLQLLVVALLAVLIARWP